MNRSPPKTSSKFFDSRNTASCHARGILSQFRGRDHSCFFRSYTCRSPSVISSSSAPPYTTTRLSEIFVTESPHRSAGTEPFTSTASQCAVTAREDHNIMHTNIKDRSLICAAINRFTIEFCMRIPARLVAGAADAFFFSLAATGVSLTWFFGGRPRFFCGSCVAFFVDDGGSLLGSGEKSVVCTVAGFFFAALLLAAGRLLSASWTEAPEDETIESTSSLLLFAEESCDVVSSCANSMDCSTSFRKFGRNRLVMSSDALLSESSSSSSRSLGIIVRFFELVALVPIIDETMLLVDVAVDANALCVVAPLPAAVVGAMLTQASIHTSQAMSTQHPV